MFDKLHDMVQEGKLRWEAHVRQPDRVGFRKQEWNDAPDTAFEDPDGYVTSVNKDQWIDYENTRANEPAVESVAEPADETTPAEPAPEPAEPETPPPDETGPTEAAPVTPDLAVPDVAPEPVSDVSSTDDTVVSEPGGESSSDVPTS